MDDDIVIHDWSLWCCCPNWYYTSITRARDFNRVKFYKYDTDENNSSQMQVETYFRNKVAGYKEQDKKAGRDIEGDYVDIDFLMNMMNTTCQNCNEPLTLDIEYGSITSNITCQRVNCDEAHFKDNCIGFCHQCNCAFSNKIMINIMGDKQKITNDIYFDRAGFGSKSTTLKDAREKDKSITMADVEKFFKENVEAKRKPRGTNSFIAPSNNHTYQMDIFLGGTV